MHTVLHRIITFMVCVFLGAAIALNAQEPQVPITLFLDANEAQLTPEQSNNLSRIRSKATTKAAHLVRVKSWEDIEQLVNTDAIQINLFPGVQFVADKTRIESWDKNEYSWVGKPRNGREMGEYVILSFTKKNLSGIIWVNSTLYGVSSMGSNILVVREFDQSKWLPEHPPGFESGAMIDSNAPLGSPEGTGSSPNSLGKVAASHPTYDLMVFYTDSVRSEAYPDSNLISMINLAVAQANTVYGNSDDGAHPNLPIVRLVYKDSAGVGGYNEDPVMSVNLNRLWHPSDTYMDDVHDLRDTYGADVVVLLTHNSDPDYNGLAKQIKATVSTAFAVIQWDALWNYTLIHEIGHLFGGRHDDPIETYPYLYGHAWAWPGHYQTVLSVKPNTPRIPYLSCPTLDPIDNEVYIGHATYKDNARVHHERSAAVAGFKSRPPLTVYIDGPEVAYIDQSDTWTAHASGETGFYSYQWYYRSFDTALQWVTLGQDDSTLTYAPDVCDGDLAFKVEVEDEIIQVSASDWLSVDCEDCEECEGEGKRMPEWQEPLPKSYALTQNSPNPFNPATTIRYDLPEASNVSLVIYDIAGREVRSWNLQESAGYRQVLWYSKDQSGRSVPAGIYIYRITAASIESNERFMASRKMVLLK